LQKNNNNKLEMEKGEEETLDESSINRQESVLLKVEKACHPTPERESLQDSGWKTAN
jgi:hypothetical protein